MKFFDFLYFSIYRFYSDNNEKGAASTAAAIIGGFQAFNVLMLIMLFQFRFNGKASPDKLLAIVLVVFFQITTWYRYNYKEQPSVETLEKMWEEKPLEYRKQHSAFQGVYGILTIAGFFGLAIYLGYKNRGL